MNNTAEPALILTPTKLLVLQASLWDSIRTKLQQEGFPKFLDHVLDAKDLLDLLDEDVNGSKLDVVDKETLRIQISRSRRAVDRIYRRLLRYSS